MGPAESAPQTSAATTTVTTTHAAAVNVPAAATATATTCFFGFFHATATATIPVANATPNTAAHAQWLQCSHHNRCNRKQMLLPMSELGKGLGLLFVHKLVNGSSVKMSKVSFTPTYPRAIPLTNRRTHSSSSTSSSIKQRNLTASFEFM